MKQVREKIPFKVQLQEEYPIINYKRVWYRIIHYWYLVFFSLFLAFIIAFLYNRYASKMYSISTSIIIKESEEAGQTAELLYNNPLINAYRNFLNEPYLIKSYPLIQQVVDSLGYTSVIYQVGSIKTSEIYNVIPIKISGNKKGDSYFEGSFEFEMLDSQNFKLVPRFEPTEDTVKLENVKYYQGIFNKPVKINGFDILVEKTSDLEKYVNIAYILDFINGYDLAKSYSSRLKVEWAEEGASVINLSINGALVEKEMDFLSMLIEIYKFHDLAGKKEAATNSKLFIDKQLSYIADSLLLVELQLERFKDENTKIDLGKEAQRLLLSIDELEKAKSELIVKYNYYQYLDDFLNDNDFENHIVLPSTVGINDPVLVNLIRQMTELQIQAKALGDKNYKKNPLREKLIDQINDLRHAIIACVEGLKKTDQIKELEIKKKLNLYEKELNSLPSEERQRVTIERNYHLGESLYVFLTQKRTEAAISEASTTSDIVIVNNPGQDGDIIAPQKKQNYLFAIFLGLGLPFIAFILLEVTNTKVQSREDIDQVTSVPIIGVIGHNRDTERMVVSNKPKSALAEAFRSLRSNINYFIKNDMFVMMITSSISGEGKSFTALNLANIIALSGKKTLILGADMRKPRLYQELSLNNNLGLSNYLSGSSSWSEIIRETEIENLSIIVSGPIPPNPGELLLRGEFSSLIDKLKTKFDVIIIDTPPIGVVADALEVAPLVDHTLFIARQNYTPKEAIVSLQHHLDQGKLKNISLVFNDIYKFGPGYGYGYGYSYGYGYGYGFGYGRKKNRGGYYEDS